MTTTGPSDQELAKKYWKNQYGSLRHRLEESNPDMATPSTGSKAMPWRAVQDAVTAGASTRAFMQAFEGANDNGLKQKVSPADVATAKSRIIEAMVKAGRDTAYIEDAMTKIGPHLDIFALSTDPAVQSILLQRIMNGNSGQNFGMHDLVDAVKLVNDVRGPQTQTQDPASLMNAAGNLFRTGVETARGRNDGIDMSQVLAMQQASHERMIQSQQEHFKEIREIQSQQPTLVDSLRQYRELQDLIGTTPDKPEVALRKLELADKREERQFSAIQEEKKSKSQTEMFKTITGGLTKVFESDIVRTIGKSVGKKLPGGDPIARIDQLKNQAVVEQITNPLDAQRVFDCPKCRKRTTFTVRDLTLIRDNGGRWACDGPNCHEVYVLRNDEDSKGDVAVA